MKELEKKPYATSFRFKSVVMYKADNENGTAEITLHDGTNGMLVSFQYNEDIMWPSYGGTMVIVDSAQNFISTSPIQGFERVVVEVDDLKDTTYTYEFRVHSVFNRVSNNGAQVYTLGLISQEGLLIEGIRVNTIRKGNSSTVVRMILKDYLKVKESEIFTEPAATALKLLPTKKTPFSVIRSLCPKTVSEKTSIKIQANISASAENNNTESDVNPQLSLIHI